MNPAIPSIMTGLDTQLDSLTSALLQASEPNGILCDPLTEKPTPTDHYAQNSCALAFSLRDPDDPRAQRALNAWLDLRPDQRDHAPFNRFLLLLLKQILESSQMGCIDLVTIDAALSKCPLKLRYPSNNWSLLAQLCRIMAARTRRERIHATHGLETMLQHWTTPAGGFIDFPQQPGETGFSTPLAYHHKALLVTSVALRYTESSLLSSQLKQLLNWVTLSWDGHQHVGGFGRSTHSLFGDACLLASLLLLGFSEKPQPENPGDRILGGIVHRWASQSRADGFLDLNPAGQQGQDDYMFVSVYNAWAAAIVGWARHTVRRTQNSAVFTDEQIVPQPATRQQDDDAGLLRLDTKAGITALLSTRGQIPQTFSRNEVELRYAGGLPFHIRLQDTIICPPATRVNADELIRQPARAGWTPIVVVNDTLFGLTNFDTVSIEETDSNLRLILMGTPVALLRPEDKTPWQRLIAAVDWRLLNGTLGRQQVFHRQQASAIRAKLVLSVAQHPPRLIHELTLDTRQAGPVRYLNPAGHALISCNMPVRRECLVSTACSPPADRDVESVYTDFLDASQNSSMKNARGYSLPEQIVSEEGYYHRLTLTW